MVLLIIVVAVLLLLLLGGFVLGLTLKLLGIVLAGLIIGAIARLVLPGRQAVGWLGTVLYGIAGSLIGAISADILDAGGLVQFLLAVVAAAVLIAVFAGRGAESATAP